jgi:signal transduction histidine kinase
VLVNLIRNAKRACQDSSCKDRQMTVRLTKDNDRVKVSVTDNGIGIPAENLTRIFHHGFTTRKDGHGFGLHSGALAAKEMDGSLTVQSEGAGCGATFTLELPCRANDEPVKALPSQENLAAAGH